MGGEKKIKGEKGVRREKMGEREKERREKMSFSDLWKLGETNIDGLQRMGVVAH